MNGLALLAKKFLSAGRRAYVGGAQSTPSFQFLDFSQRLPYRKGEDFVLVSLKKSEQRNNKKKQFTDKYQCLKKLTLLFFKISIKFSYLISLHILIVQTLSSALRPFRLRTNTHHSLRPTGPRFG